VRGARTALLVGVGLVAGGVCGLGAAAALSPKKPLSKSSPAEASPPAAVTSPASVDGERLVAIEQRLGALESAGVSAPPATPSAPTPPATADLVGDGNAETDHAGAHAAAVAAHAREPRDARWARSKADSLRGNLEKVHDRAHFQIDDVDCRSETCVATLSFESYTAAQAGWQQALVLSADPECSREIALDPPSNSAGRFPATLVYDCKNHL
jgi:hypothetical protein